MGYRSVQYRPMTISGGCCAVHAVPDRKLEIGIVA